MNTPVPDSANYEALESLVELHYQLKGYITSSGKWVPKGRDIDVLAIGENETIIVSVTTNLDDKNLGGLQNYFREVQKYLSDVNEYKWLVKKPRKVERVVAFHEPSYAVESRLKNNSIRLLSADEIVRAIYGYFDENLKHKNKSIKSQNQIFRTLQILKRLGWFNRKVAKK